MTSLNYNPFRASMESIADYSPSVLLPDHWIQPLEFGFTTQSMDSSNSLLHTLLNNMSIIDKYPFPLLKWPGEVSGIYVTFVTVTISFVVPIGFKPIDSFILDLVLIPTVVGTVDIVASGFVIASNGVPSGQTQSPLISRTYSVTAPIGKVIISSRTFALDILQANGTDRDNGGDVIVMTLAKTSGSANLDIGIMGANVRFHIVGTPGNV